VLNPKIEFFSQSLHYFIYGYSTSTLC